MEQRKKKRSRLLSLFLALAVSLASVSALPAGAEDAADIQPAITAEEAPETTEAPATAEATATTEATAEIAEAPATAEATAETAEAPATTEATAETTEAVEGSGQEEPVKAYETFTMAFTSNTSQWSFDGVFFTSSDLDQTVKASTWEWYGSGDTDKGYPAKTLVLKDGFYFSTSAVNAIEIEGNATIIIQGECTVSGLVHSIYCSGNAVIKSDVNSDETVIGTLNAGENIKADNTLKISGVNIVSEPTIASAYCVIEAKTVDLSECDITVGGAWKDQTIIYSSDNTIIRRGVRLDIPAGVIALGSVNYSYIAEVDEIENIRLDNGTELTVDNFQCEIMDGSYFAAVDDSKRMILHTAEFSVPSEDHYLYDESVSDPDKGEYYLLSKKTYAFDLADYLSEKTLEACTMYLTSIDDRGDSLLSPRLEGNTLYITPKDSSASDYTLYLNLLDDKMKYGSGKTCTFTFRIGEIQEMSKLSFYHEGDYVMGEAHKTYSMSVYVDGKKLEEYDEGTDSHYFLIPSGKEFTFTLMPEDGYKLENTIIWLSGNRERHFILFTGTASYAIDEDCTFHITISRTLEPQYIKADVSDELRQMVADGKIESVELLTAGTSCAVLDSETDQFPINYMNSDVFTFYSRIKICVSSEDIDGESQPAYGVKSICGISTGLKYDNDSKIYDLSMIKFNADTTTITAEIGRLCDISTLHTNADASYSLINRDLIPNTNGRYYVGDEYGITALPINGKLFGSATFNGKKTDMDNEDHGYWHFKVVPEEGNNEFVLNYSDISTLRITKPENGTIEFQSDIGLIGGREVETLKDGTQVYTLGTQDEVTLTLTPASGYELKSATLDGKAVTVTNNQYTFNIEKLADWTFSAEFVEKPETVTVTVDCGEHGKVTPGTAEYEKGTEITLTVTPDSGYKVKSVTLDGKAVTLTNGKYTFTVQADCVFKAEFEKTSTTGGGGGSGGRPTRPAAPTTDTRPAINGTLGSWSDIEVALRKLPAGGSAVISLNGEVKVPADVISAIASGKLRVEFVVDTAKSWLVNGADITAPCEADLAFMQGRADSSALRGVTGADLIVNGTKIPAGLLLKFRSEFAGKFANVYTLSGGALKFLGCEKLGTDGSVTLSGVNGAGEYVVMLCELSDLPGDMNNDGVLNALDAAAILKDIVKSSKGENPLVADLDGNGKVDALDAAAVLKLVTLN